MPIDTLLTTPVTVQFVDVDRGVVGTADTSGYLEARGDVLPGSDEPWIVASETFRATWRLYLPAGVVINSADRVVVGADTFDVVDVDRLVNPRTGLEHHLEATVTRLAPADTLVTVLRPDVTSDGYDTSDAPGPATVVEHVRCWLTPMTGGESITGAEETVLFQFNTDPCDLRHYDQLRDETTGELLDVVWVKRVGLAAGRAHMTGEARLVMGAG
jgi:hypothetical protein